jgi:zinc D-Ala-D-Ala carboxypeptidase
MNLSRFFTLEELTFSNTAKAEGINNQPPAAETESLRALCTAVLDPLREAVGRPIKVTSGYRGPALNRRVGGATKSQHLNGQAADIQAPGLPVVELFKAVIRLGLPFDQIIYEVKGASKWVHVSHNPGANAGEILLAQFSPDGRVTYPRITADQALAMSEPVSRSRGPDAAFEELADEPERAAAPAPAPAPAPAAKKARVLQPAAKKVTAPKKAAAAKAPVKKAAKKAATKKAAPKRAAVKKPAARKTPTKKAAATRAAPRKAPARKAATKNTEATKTGTRKAAAGKAPAKKAAAKRPATVKAAVAKKAQPAQRKTSATKTRPAARRRGN